MVEIGVIHGRFQILHHDHLRYLLAGKERCQHLIVGITNPDPGQTRLDKVDPHRSSPEANPLTYYERYLLVRAALLEAGVPFADFSIVPLPINFPNLIHNYVPMDATFFLTIYDEWGKKKLNLLQELGVKTEILWERPLAQKGLKGSEVRQRILKGESWQYFVPNSVAAILTQLDIQKRLKELSD